MLWRNVSDSQREFFRRQVGLSPGVLMSSLQGNYEAANIEDSIQALLADLERAKTAPDAPMVPHYEWTSDWPEPTCPIAVPVGRTAYKPCSRQAGREGLCSRHRPDILRAPPVPNIVGEGWD